MLVCTGGKAEGMNKSPEWKTRRKDRKEKDETGNEGDFRVILVPVA